MIVCKIELWPRGDKTKARTLGTVVIANDGTGTPEHGNYDVALSHAGVYRKEGEYKAWKGGRVLGHYRMLSPYYLLQAALKTTLTLGPAKALHHRLVWEAERPDPPESVNEEGKA
jgi:hypothetical protein